MSEDRPISEIVAAAYEAQAQVYQEIIDAQKIQIALRDQDIARLTRDLANARKYKARKGIERLLASAKRSVDLARPIHHGSGG